MAPLGNCGIVPTSFRLASYAGAAHHGRGWAYQNEWDLAMPARQQTFDEHDLDEQARVLQHVDPGQEEAYWRRAFWRERYYSQGLGYEDYAPAYCVGYVGHAQYGGNYEDAEKSLCANWERIKGDSRLSSDDARAAMRAAWNRMAARNARAVAAKAIDARRLRQRMRMPSFKLTPALSR
jgi:hypothetical protein